MACEQEAFEEGARVATARDRCVVRSGVRAWTSASTLQPGPRAYLLMSWNVIPSCARTTSASWPTHARPVKWVPTTWLAMIRVGQTPRVTSPVRRSSESAVGQPRTSSSRFRIRAWAIASGWSSDATRSMAMASTMSPIKAVRATTIRSTEGRMQGRRPAGRLTSSPVGTIVRGPDSSRTRRRGEALCDRDTVCPRSTGTTSKTYGTECGLGLRLRPAAPPDSTRFSSPRLRSSFYSSRRSCPRARVKKRMLRRGCPNTHVR